MNLHIRLFRVNIFKKDFHRDIDDVIDYFGEAPRGRAISFERGRRGKGSRLRLVR